MRLSRWLMMCAVLAIVFGVTLDTSAQSGNLQIKGPRDASDQYSGAVYGPIDASDTLWRISSRYRQTPSVTVYQVMVAIYDLNPDAFEQENLNLLVDGATLRLPSERFVARFDPEQARLRAERDDQVLASLRATSTDSATEGSGTNNIKPPGELVKKSDLDETATQLEQKLSRLDEQQIEQFEMLRQQFAASIDNVQSLIDENRKVFERLDDVNQDIETLRSQVEEQVQPQIDQQVELQQRVLSLIEDLKERNRIEDESSFTNMLTSPAGIIGGSSLITLLLLGAGIYWFLKRNSQPAAAPAEVAPQPIPEAPMSATQPQMDDLSDSLMDDLATPDADDDLFNDDELLDDVLSEELEESLDDAVENELDSYADLSDEMLVPEMDDDDSLFEDDDELMKELEDASMDELDSIDLSDDDDIDLSDALADDVDQVLADELDAADELGGDDLDELFDEDDLGDVDSQLAEELTSDDDLESALDDALEEEIASNDDLDEQISAEVEQALGEDDDEAPEISIDDLLDEPEPTDDTPKGIDVDVETGVSNQMLEQLGDEVASQNEAIDKVTDEILNELDQIEMMQGMLGDDDLDDEDEDEGQDEAIAESAPQQDIQALDDFADDLDIEDVDAISDPLTDDLLDELTAENPDIADEIDVNESIADELLAEMELEQPEESAAEDALSTDEAIDDPLTDELLAELELENPAEDEESQSELEVEDPLTDELLAELEAEQPESDDDSLTDELLAEFEQADDASTDDDDTISSDPLTDELLAELEADETENLDNEQEFEVAEDDTFSIEEDPLSETDDEVDEAATDSVDALSGVPEDDSLDQSSVEDVFEVEDAADEDVLEMDDIPSLGESDGAEGFNDELLDAAFDEFEIEEEPSSDEANEPQPAAESSVSELDDVPGLGDWLSDDAESDSDTLVLEEIEDADFDELLDSIDAEVEGKPELKLDNPDLDLEALFTEEEAEPESTDGDFVDVDTLIEESNADDGSQVDDANLNLDVALEEFTGVTDDDVVVDVDSEGMQSANLDLARAYIEMDDSASAKDLLEEVIRDGSEDEQKEAQKLLESLS